MKRDAAQNNLRLSLYDLRLWYSEIAQQHFRIARLNWPLILMVLVGLGLRLWLLHVSPLDPRFSNADDGDYYRRALRLAVTGQYIDDAWLIRPPLHVFFFAFWLRFALVIGQPQLGVLFIQVAQSILGTLTALIGYDLARRLFKSTVAGWLFGAFLSVWYPLIEQATVLFSELLYLFLFLLHVWLLVRFDATNRWRDLALAGLALGAAALTRSPALYSLAFVVLWLAVRRVAAGQRSLAVRARQGALLIVCCLAIVGPWTARNYVVYQRVIPVDTLGPINLWLDLDRVSRRDDNIAALRRLPQADRQTYATAQVRAILAEDPLRPFRPMWSTFRHIWKAQYVEDFFVKQSFFGRALRESVVPGLIGDLIWAVFTLGGLAGLALPLREGLHSRLFFLAWLGYAFLTVLVFHVEPRYLLPIWTLLGLYGAGTLSRGPALLGDVRRHPWNGLAAAGLAAGFLVLLMTYRDYPALLARGLARERAIISGERAYQRGDYAGAERAFREALAVQPQFIDSRVSLALAIAAQGRSSEAAALLSQGSSRQSDLVIGALARDTGNLEVARNRLARVEAIAGEDTQRWSLAWLRPPPTNALAIGDGLDLGYISGFSLAEAAPDGPFRWLEGDGQIVLPLATPLQSNASLVLRLAGGMAAETPLEVRIGDGPPWRISVAGGAWRTYWLPIPAELAGRQHLVVTLHAPTFVPARLDPASSDARTLSLRISAVRVG